MAENGLKIKLNHQLEGEVPDLETQRNKISECLGKPLKKGDTWYLIDSQWFKQWKKFVGYDDSDVSSVKEDEVHPGPIDNSALYKDGSGELKDRMMDEMEYVLLPQEGWNLLHSWYTLAPGQEPIARKVVEYGMFMKQCKVEVYLMELKLCENSNLEHCISHKFSKDDTVGYIEKVMKRLFDIPENKETRMWIKSNSNTYDYLSSKDTAIEDSIICQGQVLVIEKQNDDGTWPRQLKRTTRSYGTVSGINFHSYDYNSGGMGKVQPGLCGLSNLGNTCFMNSALQCMSNTPPLTEYFLKGKYWDELNVNNPLGMKGEIAKSYGELMKTIWSGQFTYTIPRCFKLAVGRFAPQFSGYQQQDCQELMAFLLDGLHEDLNRVKKKPYIEVKDADGRPDEVVAKEAWENYLKRNNSIIVDIFHGLLKSTLVCPVCSKVSVTFDPSCYLSLPLPVRKERQIEIFLVKLDASKRILQMKVTVPKMGCVQDLCEAVAKLADVQADRLVVTSVYNHRFHKIFQGDEGLSNILEQEKMFVYEVAFTKNSNYIVLPVCMRDKRLKTGMSNYAVTLFGHPLLVSVPRYDCTYELLYNTILRNIFRYVRQPNSSEKWWIENNRKGFNGEVEMSIEDNSDNDQLRYNPENLDDSDTEERRTRPPNLFTIVQVNPYANVEVEKLKDDGKPLKLLDHTYFAIDWHPMAKEKFYDEKEANEYVIHESVNTKFSQKRQVIQLSDCLKLFMTTEKLGAKDPWYCPECKKHQQATKKFDLWSLPQVLIIHLKRFSYNRYWRDKIDTLVDFPVRGLDMTNYAIDPHHGPATYDLIAVANHFGGMGGGHYTAYAKNKETQQWYYFDDSSVSSASEENVVSKAAYVLFYLKKPGTETNPSRKEGTLVTSQNGQSLSNEEDYNMDIH
ncbi:ubiquitin carboxyl-terminal hydrolase 15-like isoform X2 [Limulus polyphemus]|uniref:Ubiquitin carboxyl-terminal hydrolase n=1 Tax=Limulus polyphemus TaxID=6850 RepID=A0ABM1T8Z6_LIMPO|nr:ubiquitin carboxyl-terminal hydrolase 15-like isoform X2 [Limulus polyphemus]